MNQNASNYTKHNMATKKILTKKAAKRPSLKETGPKEPEYMIQLSDPRMLRKDVLESLREVIVFMQGYEKFRRIQEEKVALFNTLKGNLKDIQIIIDHRVRKYLPKGRLASVDPQKAAEVEDHEMEQEVEKARVEEPAPRVVSVSAPMVQPAARTPPPNELDQLEEQLKEIERQLQGMN